MVPWIPIWEWGRSYASGCDSPPPQWWKMVWFLGFEAKRSALIPDLVTVTVDGKKSHKQPPGMVLKPYEQMAINYQPQLVSRISEPSTVGYPEGPILALSFTSVDDGLGCPMQVVFRFHELPFSVSVSQDP